MDSLTLKRHNFFQNENNRKFTHTFAPRSLILKLQWKGLKFSDVCVSWISPKIDLEINFLDLGNRSFENVSFPQQQLLSKYLTFLYLSIYSFS